MKTSDNLKELTSDTVKELMEEVVFNFPDDAIMQRVSDERLVGLLVQSVLASVSSYDNASANESREKFRVFQDEILKRMKEGYNDEN